jgi:anti-anti-sigma regulatory factor
MRRVIVDMRRIELQPKLTPDCAQALWYDLDAGDETSGLCLDASNVRHVSGAALQVLLVAKARFQGDAGFRIENPSAEFMRSLDTMGAVALVEEASK